METPWDRARKTRHQIQEERLGRLEGGSKQINSGRFWRWKRDNKIYEFLIEARRTSANSFSISRDEFLNIQKNAYQTPPGLLPGMQIDIQELQLITLRLTDFHSMYHRLIALERRDEESDE